MNWPNNPTKTKMSIKVILRVSHKKLGPFSLRPLKFASQVPAQEGNP
jgi:hypothetical protein